MRKLTPALVKKRRAIAEDVLAQLRAKKFVAVTGTYVSHRGIEGEIGDLQHLINDRVTVQRPCEVCALGSAFISAVRLYDNLKVNENTDINGGRPMRRKLAEFFTKRELGAIECSFERTSAHTNNVPDRELWDSAQAYRNLLYAFDNDARLSFIMELVADLAGERITLRKLVSQTLLKLATEPRYKTERDATGWGL